MHAQETVSGVRFAAPQQRALRVALFLCHGTGRAARQQSKLSVTSRFRASPCIPGKSGLCTKSSLNKKLL